MMELARRRLAPSQVRDAGAQRVESTDPRPFDTGRSLRRLVGAGLLASAALVLGLGSWAAETRISGAVITQGRLIVETSVKRIQPPIGGVVSELLVREGQHVRAGDVVLRLDRTEAKANLDIIRQTLDELAARRARNEAEIADAPTIVFPADLIARRSDPRVAQLLGEETILFTSRQASRKGQKEQLEEQSLQLDDEAKGLSDELAAKATEIALNDEELKGIEGLWLQHLVSVTRLTAQRREAARLGGEKAHLVSSLAEVRGKRAETKLKIVQIDADLRSEDAKEIGETRAKASEFEQKRVAAEDQLKHIELKAPLDGFVHALTVHTIGGVVSSGETAMLIVPDDDALTVETHIQPGDIDQVHLGQHAVLRFPGLGARSAPELNGTVSLVSADLDQDEKLGISYYTIRISLPPAEVARLGAVKLVPGMPVEAFIETKPRTVLSYLVQPMRDQVERAFRER